MSRPGLERLTGWLQAVGGPPPIEVAHSPWGYRHRARLSVRQVRGRLRLGLFEEGSHRLVGTESCPLHHPSLVEVTLRLQTLCEEAGIPAYGETHHTGLLRAVQLAVERSSGKVQVVLVVCDPLESEPPLPHFAGFFAKILAEPLVHSLWLNAQPGRTNTLMSERFYRCGGPATLQDQLGGALHDYPPGAFSQANLPLHEWAVARIGELVPSGASVAEYHAGVGTIGLGLLARGEDAPRKLFLNEIGASSLEGLRLGVARSAFQERTEIGAGPARNWVDRVDGADVVLVDPPRKGLEAELILRLCASPPSRLIYLSCGLDALLTEGDRLIAAGLRPVRAWAMAYFPFTEHVETLMVFDRV